MVASVVGLTPSISLTKGSLVYKTAEALSLQIRAGGYEGNLSTAG